MTHSFISEEVGDRLTLLHKLEGESPLQNHPHCWYNWNYILSFSIRATTVSFDISAPQWTCPDTCHCRWLWSPPPASALVVFWCRWCCSSHRCPCCPYGSCQSRSRCKTCRQLRTVWTHMWSAENNDKGSVSTTKNLKLKSAVLLTIIPSCRKQRFCLQCRTWSTCCRPMVTFDWTQVWI